MKTTRREEVLSDPKNKKRYESIRSWIAENGKSIQWLSTATNISRTTLSKCIGTTPSKKISDEYAEIISNIMGVSVEEISTVDKIRFEKLSLGDVHFSDDAELSAYAFSLAKQRVNKATEIKNTFELALREMTEMAILTSVEVAKERLESVGYGVLDLPDGVVKAVKNKEKELIFKYAGFYCRRWPCELDTENIIIEFNTEEEIPVIMLITDNETVIYAIDTEQAELPEQIGTGVTKLYLRQNDGTIKDARGFELEGFRI